MLMGKVVGHIVSTRKNDKLVGSKILEIRLIENTVETDKYLVANAYYAYSTRIVRDAADALGYAARLALDNTSAPTDAVIVGIVDENAN